MPFFSYFGVAYFCSMKHSKSLWIALIAFLCLSSADAQFTYYYLNPNTGMREIIYMIETPLGTEAKYRNDYSMTDFKDITIKGDPVKKRSFAAVLPTQENVTITMPNNAQVPLKVTYANGQTKLFKDAILFHNKKGNQIAYFAITPYVVGNEVKYKAVYKSWNSKTEEEAIITGSGDENGEAYYHFIMPDNSLATLREHAVEGTNFVTAELTDDLNGNKVQFVKEQ